MFGRKAYAALLIFWILIAALGAWAMIDGAIAWRQRPRIETDAGVRARQIPPEIACTEGAHLPIHQERT